MSKPVELITINALHSMFDKIQALPVNTETRGKLLALLFEPAGAEAVARSILQCIAAEASAPAVLRALQAVGAPSDLAEIRERLIATRDSRRAEDGRSI